MPTQVVMPQLGESVIEGTVGKWLKQPGDTVEQYEPMLEVITDKVTTEIPAPASGTLLEIRVPEGTTVAAGTVLALIGQPQEQQATPAHAAASAHLADTAEGDLPGPSRLGPVSAPAPVKHNGGSTLRLTPVVARMIDEFHISEAELQTIQGTGHDGRISKKDIENFLKKRETAQQELAPWEQPGSGDLFRPTEEIFKTPPPSPAKPTPTTPAPERPVPAAPASDKPRVQTGETARGDELEPLSPIRRTIAEHMVRSKHTAPHVTTVHEADMSRVIAHLQAHADEFKRQGVRLTYTPYFVQAAVHALQAVPLVNAQFTEQGILHKRDLNIGIAVATDAGLLVPVIKHAADKSLLGLARAVEDLAARARDKKLAPDDITGGTFTITNYGVFGSLFGTPVINQPQAAILGVGAIQKRVVVINDAIAIRPMVYLALTFDHRLLDGAVGDRFMSELKQFLEHYGE